MVYGRDPKPEEECTTQRPTGSVVEKGLGPMCRFRHMGPGPSQASEKVEKKQAARSTSAGGFAVGVGAVELEPLLDYGRHITSYASHYSELRWHFLYGTDVRCHLEHMEPGT